VIAECRPNFGNALDRGLYWRERPARNSVKNPRQNRRGIIESSMCKHQLFYISKDEMPSLLLLDEKICFIRLPPDTLQNFWQIITTEKCHL
jgi:NAD-dependent dihydropyrimidine dehydrogenase PreA subunit